MRYLMLGFLLLLPVMTGCGPYQLQGTVIEGAMSQVVVVSADDPRLQQAGLEGVSIDLTLQPNDIKPKPFGPAVSDSRGRFRLPVNEPGAGFLIFDAMITARKMGYQSTWPVIPLPGGNERVLIILNPGRDDRQPPSDILRQTIEMGRQFQRE